MRTLLLLVVALSACKWTEFDDISNATWAHAVQKPGEVGSSDYALAIVGATGSAGSGGTLGVISNIPPTYSTIDYAAGGSTSIGPDRLHLADDGITSLSDDPILVAAPDGTIALVTPGTASSTLSVVTGPPGKPQHATITTSSPATPDAATFAGTTLVTAADALYLGLDDAAASTPATPCTLPGATPERAAALAANGSELLEWSQAGNLWTMQLGSPPACPASSAEVATGFSPGLGAQIEMVGSLAVLAAHGPQSTASMVIAVDTSATPPAIVGTPMSLDGLASATVLTVGGTTYLALGFPDRTVGGVATGQVELHVVDATMGVHPDIAETLNDAQPQTGEKFGRNLATMTFNGSDILVVGADSEVFAYYRTLLYADTRN